jgi:hypothetical protein
LDPLIKSQLAPLEYQWLAGKLVTFSDITDQTVTLEMQTANWDPLGQSHPIALVRSQVGFCLEPRPSLRMRATQTSQPPPLGQRGAYR